LRLKRNTDIFPELTVQGCNMTKIIDLSHPIEDGMITYTGLPGPKITDHLSREASRGHYAEGTTFQIGRIEMVANTGTYIDAPFHRYADRRDLSQFDLESVANLDGLVFATDPATRAISPNLFQDRDVSGKAILVYTGWDQHWSTGQYFENHPFLTRESAEYLKSSGAALVGIDSLNIDDNTDGARPAHTVLLGAEIPIVEHMCNLDSLPGSGFKFFAVPAPVKGMGSFPVRAFAIF
jgi:kynurenine formamidase